MKFVLDTSDGMLYEHLIQDYPRLKKFKISKGGSYGVEVDIVDFKELDKLVNEIGAPIKYSGWGELVILEQWRDLV